MAEKVRPRLIDPLVLEDDLSRLEDLEFRISNGEDADCTYEVRAHIAALTEDNEKLRAVIHKLTEPVDAGFTYNGVWESCIYCGSGLHDYKNGYKHTDDCPIFLGRESVRSPE